jgi:mono/diheme cytochrome c family protein
MLADVPRGSWRWAEQIVAETKAMLLDSVVALVRISERRGDVSLARWSLTQGWLLDRRSPVLAELAETLPRIQDVELGVCAGCHYRTAPVEPEGRPRVRVGEEFVAAGRVFRVAA